MANKNSSNMPQSSTLAWVTKERALNFLERMANLKNDLASTRRFQKRYGKFLEGFAQPAGSNDQLTKTQTEYLQSLRDAQVFTLHLMLQELWKADSLREKEFRLSELRVSVMGSISKARREALIRRELGLTLGQALNLGTILMNPASPVKFPPPHPFERVIQYLAIWLMRTRYCAHPKCSEPYFIGTRKNQKFCSEECSKPAQQEFKRRWWQTHGRDWRSKRRNKRARRKGPR
jgi:hypothetical protein